MRLVKFTVEKYRSILAKSVLPISDYTVVLGPNNQGKSNLLRGLSVALRIMQRALEFPFAYRRSVLRSMPYRYMVRELYDWETDYPIQKQRSKTIRGSSRKFSVFILDFKIDEGEKDEIAHKIGVNLPNDIVSVKLELGRSMFKTSVLCQRNMLKDEKKISMTNYLMGNINICYIDAERTAETAQKNISELIELPIRKQFEGKEYNKFINKLQAQQEKVLEEISNTLKKSLQEFLPSIKNSKIHMKGQDFRMRSPSSMTSDIFIDDGVETPLRQKGSGVQSLIAISIANYISQSKKRGSENLILAIEEPETHLHPMAVHQVKETIEKISKTTPVVITTHSPLLINLNDVKSNIIVNYNEASPANNVKEIRDVLGVQQYDNLTNSEYVIVVEGLSDKRILEAVLKGASGKIAEALMSGRLSVCNVQGCTKMCSVITVLRKDLCRYHIVLDYDKAGKQTYCDLVKQNRVDNTDITMINTSLDGTKESELEDTIDEKLYWDALNSKYSLSSPSELPKNARARKWSERMRFIYNSSGRGGWSQEIEDDFKRIVADEVVKSPNDAVRKECRSLYKSLVARIEKMLES